MTKEKTRKNSWPVQLELQLDIQINPLMTFFQNSTVNLGYGVFDVGLLQKMRILTCLKNPGKNSHFFQKNTSF